MKKHYDKAWWAFDAMLKRGLIPNSRTYLVVILISIRSKKFAQISGIISLGVFFGIIISLIF